MLKDKPSPIDWLEKQLIVDFSLGSEILSIALIGETEESVSDLAKLVNAVRDSYMKEIVNKEQNHRLRRLDELKQLYETYDTMLREKRQKINDLANSLGSKKSTLVQMKIQSMYVQLDSVQKELLGLQSQSRKLKFEVLGLEIKLRSLQDASLPADAIEERLRQHPELIKMQVPIEDQQSKVLATKKVLLVPEKNQNYRDEMAVLAGLEKALENRRNELRPQIIKQLREEMMGESKTAISTKNEQLALLEKLEKDLEELVAKQTKEIQSVSLSSTNVDSLDEEISRIAEFHKRIGSQMEALQIETKAPSRISTLEETYSAPTRTRGDRFKMAAATGIGLFGAVLLGIALLEFSSRRVSSLGEVTQGLGLRLVGVLPRVPTPAWNSQPKQILNTRWQRALRESVDGARTMLVHAIENESLRVVMVSSAVKGEGKTLLCSHLAVSMAQSGYKTLLIDADFRHPAAHRLFELPCAPGLSEVLRGQLELEAVLHSSQIPGLAIVTAGEWESSLAEALAQKQRMAGLLDRLKAEYDFILIDTAPILPAPDTLMIGQHVDGVLFSVLQGVSRLPMVYAACERLSMLGVRVLGAVVGRAHMNTGYGYRYEAAASEVV